MPLVSSKVAAGTEILSDHFNKLREDLLTNHDHSSGKGGTVEHGNLSDDTNMAGMDHRHEDIDVHLSGDGPGPNDIDNPGGTMGVHGLAAAAFVAGSIDQGGSPAQLVFRCGTITLPVGTPESIKTVELSPPFGQILGAWAQYIGGPTYTSLGHGGPLFVYDMANASFKISTTNTGSWEAHQVYWLAVGTM